MNKNCRHEDGGLHYIKHYYCSWFPAPLTVALGVLYFVALLTILYEATEFFFVPSLQLVWSPESSKESRVPAADSRSRPSYATEHDGSMTHSMPLERMYVRQRSGGLRSGRS